MIAAALTAALALAAPLRAQVATGTILGNVKDNSGAPVPGAHRDRHQRRHAVLAHARRPTPTGQYTLPLLPVGNYKVEVTLTGFKNFSQTGIVLEVGRNARVDATIEPGNVAEVVSVVADAPLVETSIGRAVADGRAERSPESAAGQPRPVLAAERSPAASPATRARTRSAVPSSSRPSTDRRRRRSARVNFQLDGGNNTAGLRGTGNPAPNPEAVQEFRVITNSYSAEYGRYPAGVVDVVTKSGTNQFHGALFEFFRDEKLNAKRWAPPGRHGGEGSARSQSVRRRVRRADPHATGRSSSPATRACGRKRPTTATRPSCRRRASAPATSRSPRSSRAIR